MRLPPISGLLALTLLLADPVSASRCRPGKSRSSVSSASSTSLVSSSSSSSSLPSSSSSVSSSLSTSLSSSSVSSSSSISPSSSISSSSSVSSSSSISLSSFISSSSSSSSISSSSSVSSSHSQSHSASPSPPPPPPPCTPGTNLVINSQFSYGFSAWLQYGTSSNLQTYSASSCYGAGTSCAYVNALSGSPSITQTVSTFQVGASYSLQVAYYWTAVGSSPTASCWVSGKDSSNQYHTYQLNIPVPAIGASSSSSWTTLSLPFTAQFDSALVACQLATSSATVASSIELTNLEVLTVCPQSLPARNANRK
ncbi:hypothetical protein SEUCBS139899_002976 [Sporothrix eucalyptigena]